MTICTARSANKPFTSVIGLTSAMEEAVSRDPMAEHILVGLGGNLEICMFNQLPGDAATAVGILRSTGQD